MTAGYHFFIIFSYFPGGLTNGHCDPKARVWESVLLLLQPRGAEDALDEAVGLVTRGTCGAEGRLQSIKGN